MIVDMETFAAATMALAVMHTFLTPRLRSWAEHFPEGSVGENTLHLLGEVEVVFGLWSVVLLGGMAIFFSPGQALHYLESRSFAEPIFVFAILTLCSTRSILELAERLILTLSKVLPLAAPTALLATTLWVGPLLGSLITEPAAMTVTALLLLKQVFQTKADLNFKYALLGVLFVNVSIGGVLTHFAAPPVLMVAGPWGWDTPFLFMHFGWKGALASLISTVIVLVRFRRELPKLNLARASRDTSSRIPGWVHAVHLGFLAALVLSAHHPVLVAGLFLFYLGFYQVTGEFQDGLKIREALLVAFFLGGLVVLGGQQAAWLNNLLTRLEALSLYLSAIGLTAVTDNAALTYLGTLVPGLSDFSKYALVAGAVVGGGLTVIANAPNPAGMSLLAPTLGPKGFQHGRLFTAALGPTVVAGLLFWLL